MHCEPSCFKISLPFHGPESRCELSSPSFPGHGCSTTLISWSDMGVMFLLHASTSLSLLLLFVHLFAYLLINLIICLCPERSPFEAETHQVEQDLVPAEATAAHDAVDGDGGEELIFLCNQIGGEEDTLLADDVLSKISEPAYISAPEDNEKDAELEYEAVPITDVPVDSVQFTDVPHCPSPIISVYAHQAEKSIQALESKVETKKAKDEEFFVIDHSQLVGEKLRLSVIDVEQDKETLTGGSTSKSSVEWPNSTIGRDSETEYPFSSSSRRSSTQGYWEMFPKYDEEMLFFDRISAQKLTETESIKACPRSISQRILYRLTSNRRRKTTLLQQQRGRGDPYRELERAYVAQICLAWEALNWNFNSIKKGAGASCCPAHIAQQFQQFQVLLQRFIENEPYERGTRPQVFARVRISSPKLLLVPEFQGDDDEGMGMEGDGWRISSIEFLAIMEDAIRTFMNFLKADKESRCQKFRALIKNNRGSVDATYVHLLKKVNKKKKARLKDVGRRRTCLTRRRRKEDGDDQLQVLMGLIDMKVVSRVLRLGDISEQQLHWCEEKMSKIRVWEGKMQRDSSPLFFPAH